MKKRQKKEKREKKRENSRTDKKKEKRKERQKKVSVGPRDKLAVRKETNTQKLRHGSLIPKFIRYDTF